MTDQTEYEALSRKSDSERLMEYISDIAVVASRAQDNRMDTTDVMAFLNCIESTCLYLMKEYDYS